MILQRSSQILYDIADYFVMVFAFSVVCDIFVSFIMKTTTVLVAFLNINSLK